MEIAHMNDITLDLVVTAAIGIVLTVAAVIGAYMWAVTLF
jgi:hypothetical protein